MDKVLSEIGLVFLLILFNGFFSGAEMALISLRKTRIKQLVKEGNSRARLAEKILRKPEEFLATIQVGITLISTIASAFAGANIASVIAPLLEKSTWPFISTNAEIVSFGIVVAGVTYITLIFGELIPKSLGIKFSERFSFIAIYPLYTLSKISYPLTRFLTASSNLFLKIFGDKTSFSEAKLTEEELRTLLYESQKAGTIEKHEHEILDNVFDFTDISVGQIMTPRHEIFAVDLQEPTEKNIKTIIESGYTRIPVFKDKLDNIVGTINIKDLLKKLQTDNGGTTLQSLIKKTSFIPNTYRISELLRKFQKEKNHLALVTDEYGDIDGLVTIEDILEEIVGDINDESDEKETFVVRQKDGSYLVDGSVNIVDFNRSLRCNLPEDQQYTTISGLLLDKFEKIPDVGTKTQIENIEFTVKGVTERVIRTVNVRKLTAK